jgi:uncharacterized membrane protein YgcG
MTASAATAEIMIAIDLPVDVIHIQRIIAETETIHPAIEAMVTATAAIMVATRTATILAQNAPAHQMIMSVTQNVSKLMMFVPIRRFSSLLSTTSRFRFLGFASLNFLLRSASARLSILPQRLPPQYATFVYFICCRVCLRKIISGQAQTAIFHFRTFFSCRLLFGHSFLSFLEPSNRISFLTRLFSPLQRDGHSSYASAPSNGYSNGSSGYGGGSSSGGGAGYGPAPPEGDGSFYTPGSRDESQVFGKANTGINFSKVQEIKVTVSGTGAPPPIEHFDQTDLHPSLKANIKLAKYDVPTPVQKHSIPIMLADRDLMASAQTGTLLSLSLLFCSLGPAASLVTVTMLKST